MENKVELKDNELEKVSGGDGGSIGEVKYYTFNQGNRVWNDENHTLYYEANETKTFSGSEIGLIKCKYVYCLIDQPNKINEVRKESENVPYFKIAECFDKYGLIE